MPQLYTGSTNCNNPGSEGYVNVRGTEYDDAYSRSMDPTSHPFVPSAVCTPSRNCNPTGRREVVEVPMSERVAQWFALPEHVRQEAISSALATADFAKYGIDEIERHLMATVEYVR